MGTCWSGCGECGPCGRAQPQVGGGVSSLDYGLGWREVYKDETDLGAGQGPALLLVAALCISICQELWRLALRLFA